MKTITRAQQQRCIVCYCRRSASPTATTAARYQIKLALESEKTKNVDNWWDWEVLLQSVAGISQACWRTRAFVPARFSAKPL
jgi:hypothetical protein